jgi:hypothetical protein
MGVSPKRYFDVVDFVLGALDIDQSGPGDRRSANLQHGSAQLRAGAGASMIVDASMSLRGPASKVCAQAG